MVYFDDETTWKKEAAALLLLSFDAAQRKWWATLTGTTPPLAGKTCLISLCHFLLFVFLTFDILFCFLFSREDENLDTGGNLGLCWSGNYCLTKELLLYRGLRHKMRWPSTTIKLFSDDSTMSSCEWLKIEIKKDTWCRKYHPSGLELLITLRHGRQLPCDDIYSSDLLITPSPLLSMTSAMQSTPSLLLRWSSVLLQLRSGPPLLNSLRTDGNFHTTVVLWMASIWRFL